MTASEIHLTMTSGFATIAGSVLAAYIGFGVSSLVLPEARAVAEPATADASRLSDHFGCDVNSSFDCSV